MRTGPLALLDRLLRLVDLVSYGLIGLAMASMAILVSLQVFYRYVLNSSIDFADEGSRFFFVAAIFLALPHGIRAGVHVGIDLIVRALPDAVQAALFRLVCALSAGLMLVVIWTAWIATLDKWGELMPTLPISAGFYYVPVLITGVHGFLHLVLLAFTGPDILNEEPAA
ncbi:MAG: TRAP transporter small permease [Pararhodobacter sp.]|nr:TRAP transporter small permease [Pararhodobacter sp.]